MQIAVAAADFTPAEADQLRRAMGSKRSGERIDALQQRLYDGMADNGITGAEADEIFDKIKAFASFGFAESHAISFAFLVYASSWLKLYYPAAFCAALLNAQPMGFYSPQSLVHDARRHGVVVVGPDINVSGATATLEPTDEATYAGPGPQPSPRCAWGCPACATIETDLAERIVAARERDGAFTSMSDLAHRVGLSRRPGRGAGHRRRVRLLRAGPPRGAVGRRRRRGQPSRPARPADDRHAPHRRCPR